MIYLYDGTVNGFCTAFLAAFGDEKAALASGGYQIPLGAKTVNITSDQKTADRVIRRFLAFDRNSLHDLDRILRSGDDDKDKTAFCYFRLLAEKKRPVRGMLAEPAVQDADDCLRRVSYEIHHMHGFLRFLETQSGALYAAFSPDHDIADLLVPHFRARLPMFPFVIHDVKRKKAAVWDGENVFLAPLERAEVLISADENAWQNLWKTYYKSVNIPSRERLKQMRGYLPVRYVKFMPEFFPRHE